MRYWQVLLSLSCFLFIFGCSDSNSSACKDDSECKTWQVCNTSSGKCELREGYCERHADCADKGAQIYCDTLEHQCVECLQNYHCEMGSNCGANNYCVREKEVTCASDVECLGVTVKGECYIPPGYASGFCVDCKGDEDCGEGYLCNGNYKCETKTPCESEEDCANVPGLGECYILNGAQTGYCVSCLTGADCPNGTQCNDNHQCEVITNPKQCMNNADCADDHLGRTTCHILPGKVVGQCVQCSQDADCPIGQDCTLNGFCEPGNPGVVKCTQDNPDEDGPSDVECTPHAPYRFCLTKDGATDGICVECFENSDCNTGERCNKNNRCSGGDNGGENSCNNSMECLDGKHCLISNDGTGTCVECLNDAQCPPGQTCAGTNKCSSDENGCKHHGDCPYGRYCDIYFGGQGTCVQCLENDHCPAGKKCEALTCVDDGSGSVDCSNNSDCTGAEKYCYQSGDNAAICVECVEDEHCSGEEVCNPVQNCVDPNSETECKTNADCLMGVCLKEQTADTGVCVSCIKDSDCPTGQVCNQDYICVHRYPVTECNNNTDCLVGKCHISSGNTSGICVECLSDSDCPSEQLCNQYQKCTDPNEPPLCNESTTCVDPANCYTPENATNGYCLNCLTDGDCKEGEICTEELECKPETPIDTCNGSTPCDKGTCYVAQGETDGICVECFDDADCGINGICTAALECITIQITECEKDEDCPSKHCKIANGAASGVCVECSENTHCETGETCNNNNKCDQSNEPTSCSTTAQCQEEEKCYIPKSGGTGVCIDCFTNNDCKKGEVCSLNFECIPGADDGYCANDFDCADQEYERHCYVPEEKTMGQCVICHEDAHCPQGSSCQNFECIEDGNDNFEKCTKTADCSIGECYIQVGESEGICVECDEDDDCETGQVCNDAHRCENNTTVTECTQNSDCSTNVCVKEKDATKGFCGECTPENTTNCKAGETCNANNKCDDPNEPPVCSVTKPCSDNKICFIPEGETEGSCLECLTDLHCDSQKSCSDRTCDNGGIDCTTNADCNPGTCYKEAGETTGTCVDCTGQENCPTESGCTSSTQCPEGLMCIVAGDATEGSCVECLTDAECKNGQTCADQTCTNICTTNSDCQSGNCYLQPGNDTGVCIDCEGQENCPVIAKPECTQNTDCKDGRICAIIAGETSGTCVECLNDNDCSGEATCSEQVCNDNCTTTDACNGGACYQQQGNSTGTCIDCTGDNNCPGNGGNTCTSNTNCTSGSQTICAIPQGETNGTCVECLVDSDCPSGKSCSGQICVNTCEANSECAQDEKCYVQQGETTGICINCQGDANCPNGGNGGCTGDNDCDNGAICAIQEGAGSGVCVECLTDENCPTDAICVGQQCKAPCTTDGEACAEGVCYHETDKTGGSCIDCAGQENCPNPNCSTNSDCPNGTICVIADGETSGTCTECLNNGDCSHGETCSNNECGNGNTTCNTDTDCGVGHCYLPNGQKPGICIECVQDSDCQFGQICNQQHVCQNNVDPTDCSQDPSVCSDNQHCYQPSWSNKKICVDCIDQYAKKGCKEGETCNEETNQCIDPDDTPNECLDITTTETTITNPCPDGGTCYQHQTEPDYCFECLSNSDCPPGQICTDQLSCGSGETPCDENSDCDSGVCNTETGQCTECTGQQDCPEGTTCNENGRCETNEDGGECTVATEKEDCGLERHCYVGVVESSGKKKLVSTLEGDTPTGQQQEGTCVDCIVNKDCPDYQKCIEFTCQGFCGSDSDCPEGEKCDPETGECGSEDPCEGMACPDNASCEMIEGEGARCDCNEGTEFFNGECVETDPACEDNSPHKVSEAEDASPDYSNNKTLCGFEKGYFSITNPSGDDPERIYVTASNISGNETTPEGLMLTVTDHNNNVVAMSFTDGNTPCNADGSCDAGHFCNTRGTACGSENDCLFNKCVNKRCTRSGNSCQDQNDCKENYCKSGSCSLTNHECTSQQISCERNKCENNSGHWFGGTCTATGDPCMWGLFCKPNLCFAGICSVTSDSCSPIDSCPAAARTCSGGSCTAPATALKCSDHSDCVNDKGYTKCDLNVNSVNYKSCVPENQTGTLYETNEKVCLPDHLSVSYWIGANDDKKYTVEVINLGKELVGFDLSVTGQCKEDYECGGRPMQCMDGKCVEYCETDADCGNGKMVCNLENHTCVYECAAPGVDQGDSPINAHHVTLPHKTDCAELSPRDEEEETDIDWISFNLSEGDDLIMTLEYGFDPRAIVLKEGKYVTNTNFANFIEAQLFFENPGALYTDPVESQNNKKTGDPCRVEQDDDGSNQNTKSYCPSGTICSASYTRENSGVCVRDRQVSGLGQWNAPENTRKMHYKIKRSGKYYLKLSRIKPRSELTTPYTLNIKTGCANNKECSDGYICSGGSCQFYCIRHEQCHTGRGEYCGSDHTCKRVPCKLDSHCSNLGNSIKSDDRFYCSLKDPVPTCKVKLPNDDNGCINHTDSNNYESVAQPFKKSSVSYPLAGSVDPDDVMTKFELQKTSSGYAGTSCGSDQDWLYLTLENRSYYLNESNCNGGGTESHSWFDWSWGWGEFFYTRRSRVECGERYNDKCADPCGQSGYEDYYECKKDGTTSTSDGSSIGLYRCQTKPISEFQKSGNAADTGLTREACIAASKLEGFECSSDSSCRAKIGSCLSNTDCANVGPYKHCDTDARRLTLQESVDLQLKKQLARRLHEKSLQEQTYFISRKIEDQSIETPGNSDGTTANEASGGASCEGVTCNSWKECVEGVCKLKEGMCDSTNDCTGDYEICDTNSHECYLWCERNSCDSWKNCSNKNRRCELKEDRCDYNSNCTWDSDGYEFLCNQSTHWCYDPCSGVNCESHRFCNRKHRDPSTGNAQRGLCDLKVNRCDHDCNIRGNASGTANGAGCSSSELCDEGSHTCKAAGQCVECTNDSHCNDFVRQNIYHRCVANSCVECKQHSDCGEGYKCITPTTSASSMGSGYDASDVRVFRGCDQNGRNCKNDYTCLRQYPPIYTMMVTSSDDILFDIRGKNEEVEPDTTSFSLGAPYNVLAYAYSQEDSDFALAKASMIHPGKYYVHIMHEGLDFYQKAGQCRECYLDTHCATGHRCEAGTCVKYGNPTANCLKNGSCRATCNIDIDCNQYNNGTTKFVCMNMPIGTDGYSRGEVDCSSSTDCYEYETCSGGKCRPKSGFCADDNDCQDIFNPKCNMTTHQCQPAGVCAPACEDVDEHTGCGDGRYCVKRKYKYQLGSDLYKTDDNVNNGCYAIEAADSTGKLHKYLFCGVDRNGNLLSNWTRNWDQARANCRKWGYTLVTINDAAEDNLVYQKTGSHDTWYGFNDRAQEGVWVWESGEPVTYTYWKNKKHTYSNPKQSWVDNSSNPYNDSYEPNNAGNEDCALSWTGSQYWNDLDCGNVKPYVCEYPMEDGSLGGCVECGYDIFECNYGDECSPYSNSCIEKKEVKAANNGQLKPGQTGFFPCAVDNDCRVGANPMSSNKYCYHLIPRKNVNYNVQVQILRTYNHPLFTANVEQHWWGWWRWNSYYNSAYRFLAGVQSMKCDPPKNGANDTENTYDSYRGWVNDKCEEGTFPKRAECSQYNACTSGITDHSGNYGDYCDSVSDCNKDATGYEGCLDGFHCLKSCQTNDDCGSGSWCDSKNQITPGKCHRDCTNFPQRDEYDRHYFCSAVFPGHEADCNTSTGRCEIICQYDSECMSQYGRFSSCLSRPKLDRRCQEDAQCIHSPDVGAEEQIGNCQSAILDGRQYVFCSDTKTWTSAKSACENLGNGFSLVTINSGSENSNVFNRAKSQFGANFWIGLNDRVTENKFLWASGQENDYTNYDSGEPNNASNEDCIHMWGSGTWNDNQCSNRYPYVCEYNIPQVCDLDPETHDFYCFQPGRCDTNVNYPKVTE